MNLLKKNNHDNSQAKSKTVSLNNNTHFAGGERAN